LNIYYIYMNENYYKFNNSIIYKKILNIQMFSLIVKELIRKEFYNKYIKFNIETFINIVGLEIIEYIKLRSEYKNIFIKTNLYLYKLKSK
jgi:hypothetical protein